MHTSVPQHPLARHAYIFRDLDARAHGHLPLLRFPGPVLPWRGANKAVVGPEMEPFNRRGGVSSCRVLRILISLLYKVRHVRI